MHNLVLTVIKSPTDALLKTSYQFDQRGGTIGRGPANDWVLPDPECILSGQHLEVVFDDGMYLAKDTSSNGSFLHPTNEELDSVRGTVIQNDQVIEIGDFLLHALLEVIVAEPQAQTINIPTPANNGQASSAEASPQKLSPFDITNDAQEVVNNNSPFAGQNSFDGTQEISPSEPPQELPTSEVMRSGIGSSSEGSAINSTISKSIVAGESGFTEPQSQSILGHNSAPLNPQKQQPETIKTPNIAPSSPSKVPENWDDEIQTPSTNTNSSNFPLEDKIVEDRAVDQNTHSDSLNTASLVSDSQTAVSGSQTAVPPQDTLLDTLSDIAGDRVNNLENANVTTNASRPTPQSSVEDNQAETNPGLVENNIDGVESNLGIKTPRPKPRVSAAKTEQTAAPLQRGSEYQHFLGALGLPDSSNANHSPDLFAQIFSLVTEQLISILRSRNKLRQQFRLAVTSIQKTDNNPLTFSVNTDDAIHNLFVKQNAGYLPAMESYEQAFSTIEHHQLAVIVGMRAGFENMLAAFSPESLAGLKPSDNDKKSWGIFSSDKDSFEENYNAHFQQLLKNKEQTFIQLFGEAFTHAYELSIHQQKSEEKLKQENKQ